MNTLLIDRCLWSKLGRRKGPKLSATVAVHHRHASLAIQIPLPPPLHPPATLTVQLAHLPAGHHHTRASDHYPLQYHLQRASGTRYSCYSSGLCCHGSRVRWDRHLQQPMRKGHIFGSHIGLLCVSMHTMSSKIKSHRLASIWLDGAWDAAMSAGGTYPYSAANLWLPLN
jgi:hypothetical protein